MEFFKLRWKILLAFALVIGGLLFATLLVANRIIDASSEDAITIELQNTRKVFEGLLEERKASLYNLRQAHAESPQLKAALDLKVQDPATTDDLGLEIKGENFDLLQIVGRKGSLLTDLRGRGPQATREFLDKLEGVEARKKKANARDAKPLDPFFAAAIDKKKLEETVGAWASSDTLYEIVTGPVDIQDSVLGGLRLGFAMDKDFATALRDQTGSEVAVLVGGKILASSLEAGQEAQLASSLSGMMGKAQASGNSGVFETLLGETPFLGQFVPVNGPDEKKAAEILQLRSKARVLELLSMLRKNFFFVFASGLLLALLVAFFVSRGITKPLDTLIQATRQVDAGNLDFTVNVDTRDELGVLADSFNLMVKDLKEKERVKGLFGKYLPKAVAEKVMGQQGELKLGGEQLETAILFSDIRGFTALSERLSPPELVAMLNDYYTRMIDVLFENGGTLDKTIGDAIMAVFGAPVPDPDCSVKAIKTALGMQEGLKAFNDERRANGLEPFEIGIGINTGVVVAGNLGSVKQFSYTVIGEEVNLASRMCSVAKKGQVIVTENTYRKTKWQFEFNRLEPVTVKNVSHPVQVYEVLGIKKDAQSPQ